MAKKAFLSLGILVMTVVTSLLIYRLVPKTEEHLTVDLNRGPLTVYAFPSKRPVPLAIILFGSGDGGWGGLEETIGHAFQNYGYELIGIDFEDYARTDYDLDTLQSDFTKMARMAEAPYGGHPSPLIVGGYSMGAAQAIAVAGGPKPPPGLIGVLLVDPCSRGRYGLRPADQMNVLPTGPGTFGVDSFAGSMSGIPKPAHPPQQGAQIGPSIPLVRCQPQN